MEVTFGYKIWVEYLFSRVDYMWCDTLESAQTQFELYCKRKMKQGYNEPEEFSKEAIVKTDDEWTYTMTRVPFYGSQGDPATGEVTVTPTSMTETITVHLELRPKQVV